MMQERPASRVAGFDRAREAGEVSAEGANGGASLWQRFQSYNQKNRGATERCGYWLREGAQTAWRVV